MLDTLDIVLKKKGRCKLVSNLWHNAHVINECFNQILQDWKPKIYLHGHVHMNYGQFPREYDHFDTHVINAYDHYEFEMDVPNVQPVRRTFPALSFPSNFWKSRG